MYYINPLSQFERAVAELERHTSESMLFNCLRHCFGECESAYASPENFDEAIGQKISYENARNKIR